MAEEGEKSLNLRKGPKSVDNDLLLDVKNDTDKFQDDTSKQDMQLSFLVHSSALLRRSLLSKSFLITCEESAASTAYTICRFMAIAVLIGCCSGDVAIIGPLGGMLLTIILILNGIGGVKVLTVANLITMGRLIVLVHFSQNLDYQASMGLSIGMLVFCGFDYLDGYVARRLGECTLFGRIFDEEVDAFAVLMMALYVHHNHFLRLSFDYSAVGMVSGLAHYVFIIVKNVFSLDWPPRQEYARFLAGACWITGAIAFSCGGFLQLVLLTMSIFVNIMGFTYSFYQMICPPPAPEVTSSTPVSAPSKSSPESV